MKHLKTLLFLFLGAPLLVLGGWRVIGPISFHAFNGLLLVSEPGLLSEARGAGALVVGLAAVIVSSAFVHRLRPTSLLVAVVLFFSYAAGRVLGLVVDGFPPEQVIQGLVSEVVLGSLALVALVRIRAAEPSADTPRDGVEAST